jgi:hypothetical protein
MRVTRVASATNPVHGGHTDRADQRHRRHEHPGEDGGTDPDVAHSGCPRGEVLGLLVVAAEQLDQQGPRHPEALGHLRVHLRVELHGVAGVALQSRAHAAGGDQEHR